MAQLVKNLTSLHEGAGLILSLAQWIRDLALPQAVMYVDHRCGLDPASMWLWCRPAAEADLTPSLGTSMCCKYGYKKKKKKVTYVLLLQYFIL